MRFGICLAFAAASCGFAARARAAKPLTERLELSWQAPPECPAQERVWSQIEHLVASADAPEAPRLSASAQVTPREGGGFSLRLELVSGENHDTRELVGDSCQALVDSVAVMIALQLGPTEDSAPARPPAPAPPPPPAPSKPSAPPPKPAPPREKSFRFGIGGGVDSAALPSLTIGARFELGWAHSGFYLGLGYWSWAPGTRTLRDGRPGEAHFWWSAGSLSACHESWGSQAVRFGPCLAFEAGQLKAISSDIRVPGEVSEPWLAGLVGGGVAARWGFFSNVSLIVPITRPRFVVEGVGQIHQPRLLGARVSAGVALRF